MPGLRLGVLLVMKSCYTILLLTLSVLYRAECVFGKTFEHTKQEWERYRNDCILKIASEPTPSGLFCRRMFDQYACWTDGLPNTTVKVPCPWYLPWHDQVRSGFVLRECGPDGQWHTNNTSHTWRDHSQCEVHSSNHKEQEEQIQVLTYFRVMYTIGYSLSLASLTLALLILLLFRKLRCTRNYIHANLFASFILRAVSIIIRDDLLRIYTPDYQNSSAFSHALSNQTLSSCRIAQAVMEYCVGANYFWVLVEGLYIHNLLLFLVLSENHYFFGYLALGWVTPILYVVPWVVMRHLYENTWCWQKTENMAHLLIIEAPVLLVVLVNLVIFIRIMQVVVSKLKADRMRSTDYQFRLAKSTLILIPLLGSHKVVLSVVTVEQTVGLLRLILLFFELFFNSFQGFLVAILYCFVNKEVQSEIKKKWHRWKLGISTLDEHRTTSSYGVQGATGLQDHEDQPCQLDCPEESGIHLSMDPLPASTQIPLHHHHHPGAKKGKAYCYISAHKQVLNGADTPALGHCELGVEGYSDSYC
ncbi:gastric inhibitory polypeptide receptor [Neoarius graeffei]|uniref:gastric inhibitory polypeptide receptor n=1 Tax=Neoarius graeffei TaxID=443677 RepID=UPI00298CDE28|nr:gastric inhibitory polypeptide receptor [Neoarius graeffei]